MGKSSREKRLKREMVESGELEREKPERTGFVKLCLTVIRIGVYLALLTPLILNKRFYFPFVGPKSLYFMGLIEVMFFTWVILAVFSKKFRPKLNIVSISLLVFLGVAILSSFFGANISSSFWSKYERMTGILMLLHLTAFLFVLSSCFSYNEDKKEWLRIFTISSSVAVIASVFNLLDRVGVSLISGSRGGVTLGNSSFLATYLLFNVFLAFFVFAESKGWLKIYSIVSFSIVLLGLLTSTGRAATLSFFIASILLSLIYLTLYKKGILRIASSFLIALIVAFGVFGIFFMLNPVSPLSKALFEKAGLGTFGGRTVVWNTGMQSFKSRPIFGWGPENFDLAFYKSYDPCLGVGECGGDVWYDRAHNVFFDTIVSLGIVGLLSYFFMFLSVFFFLFKKLKQGSISFFAAGIFSVLLVAYFIQDLTVFDMVSSYMMFFLTLSFVASIGKKEEGKEIFKNKLLPISVISFLFIICFHNFVYKPVKSDFYVIKSLIQQDSENRLIYYKKTLETSPLGKYQIREFFGQNTEDFLVSKKISISDEKARAEVDFVISELEKTKKESPYDFRSMLRLGHLYNLYAQYDSSKLSLAEETLKLAVSLSPTNPQGYWGLAQTEVFKRNFEEGLRLAEKAVEIQPKLLNSHLIVIQIARIIGDQNLIMQKIGEALKINPAFEKSIKDLLGIK